MAPMAPIAPMAARLLLPVTALALLLSACDDETNGNGDSDTIWTGLSGLLIVIVVVWLIVRALRHRG